MNLDFTADQVVPDRATLLRHLAIPEQATLTTRVETVFAAAAELFADHAAPVGVVKEISHADFALVYHGEGDNASRGPVADIFPLAEHLALFAVTLGARIGTALERCFAAGDVALAHVLDAMASVAADATAELAERRWAAALAAQGWNTPGGTALRYSPGYCGWNVTGQKRLFGYLAPRTIGIELNESCLMQPLKSVSGVLIAGPKAIHRFRPNYDFCEACEERTCRKRIRELGR